MARGLRLDTALVERGYFLSRGQAQAAIMAGEVRINGRTAAKPSDSVRECEKIDVTPRPRYVGRGGMKLEGAIAHFEIDCGGKTALDIGASTGGFSDCLLQKGVRKVFAIDVGHGQLAWKIRDDPRVIALEKVNARWLSREQIPERIELCVIDVSFISLTLILPPAFELLTPDGVILALIKPQFELAREDVGRGGIVRSSKLHAKAQEKIATFARTLRAQRVGLFPSPITGTDGNQEFFICLRKPSE
ncbi:MAG TPA: TlyA family RNA methyltransferase [Chthoniobacterales bacterium]|jgi:23S rRNA (cytidine1920-2'-O)/16S rRNA (cytidine1409-2'-O)-methyltransferase